MTLIQKINNKTGAYFRKISERWQDFIYSNKISHKKGKSLLIIKIDSIGDYILFRNFINEIKRSTKFRNHHITLLGNVWYKEIAEKFDGQNIDEFIWADLHKLKDSGQFNALVKQIYSGGYEYAVSPNYSPSVEDLKLLWRSGARFKYAQAGDLLNISIKDKEKYQSGSTLVDIGRRYDFEFYRYAAFFKIFLEEPVIVQDSVLELAVSENKKVIICPGANSVLRMWPAKNFAELIERINSVNPAYTYILIGSPNEIQIGEEIVNFCSYKSIINQIGKLNPEMLTREIATADIVITNDTGPYHIAMALRKKTICISNGNNYGRFTPYPPEFRRNSITVLSDKVEQLMRDPAMVVKFQSEVSKEKISDITVAKVYTALNELMQ